MKTPWKDRCWRVRMMGLRKLPPDEEEGCGRIQVGEA
jgi:hypothetical protein